MTRFRPLIRTFAASLFVVGAAFVAAPSAKAQDTTVPAAAVAAPVTEVAPAPAAAAPAAAAPATTAPAAAPAGGVAAGGGFLNTNNGSSSTLPIGLVTLAVGAGGAIFLLRRRQA